MTSGAYVDRVPIVGDFSWPLKTGTMAATARAMVPRNAIEPLVSRSKAKPASLSITFKPDPGSPVTWKGITALEPGPAGNPHEGMVVLVDRRYWWRYAFAFRELNVTRRTGSMARKAEGEAWKLNPALAVAEIDLAKFSTNNGKAWTAPELLEQLISYIDGRKFTLPNRDAWKSVPIQDQVLRGNGQQVLAQLLGMIPGAEITIDAAGNVRVFSFADKAEVGLVGTGPIASRGSLKHELIGGPHAGMVERSLSRPSKIRVLFDIESEIRFDFVGDTASNINGTSTGSAAAAPSVAGTPRYVQNVLPIPDFTLTLASGAVLVGGSILSFEDYLIALRLTANGTSPGLAPVINFTTLNRAMVPFQAHLWKALGLVGLSDPAGTEANWNARIGAIQAYFRTLWQIPRDWMDRIRSLRDYLVATIDSNTGTRSPARVYGDHAIVNSQKSLLLSDGKARLSYAQNVDGWPGTGTTPADVSTAKKPTPASVEIADQDLGLLFTKYTPDPWGLGTKVLPAKIENNPTGDKRPSNAGNVYFNSVSSGSTTYPQLAEEQRLAILLTAVPANTLFAYEVSPADVSGLGPGLGAFTAHGPAMTIYSTRQTARVAWSEGAAAAIEKAFGMGADPQTWDPSVAAEGLRPYIVNLETTRGDGPGAGGASLRAVALEAAAKVWAGQQDRVEGAGEYALTDAHPVGSIDSITNSVSGGAMTSTVQLRTQLPDMDLRAFMDPGTQRALMRLVR